MKIVKISKSYERKISRDYQTYSYSTQMEAVVEIDEQDESALQDANDKLFAKVYNMTRSDIQQTMADIKPQKPDKDGARTAQGPK
jgi:hypothetical protein